MDERELRDRLGALGIRRVKVGGFDVDGVLRGKYISLEKFWSSVRKGFGFCDVIFGWDIADSLYDNAEVTGWSTGYPDAMARIDLDTFRVLPTEPDVAHFIADFYTTAGKPHPACPRNLLKRLAARAETQGYRPRFAAEFEFWIFRESPESLHQKGYRDLDPLSRGMFGYSWLREGQHGPLLREWMDVLDAYDIPIEGLHTETGPGVIEACLRYNDVLAAADQAALFKTTLKQLATAKGVSVTFMAKWNASLPGSSGHLHQSLWDPDGETNLFASATKAELSALGSSYTAGLLALMPDLTAVYAPFVNSYKRYVPGLWAPLTASWGIENRTCAVRAIPGPGANAARVECRQTASDINPYVAMAATLGSGLYGVERKLKAPEPVCGDATAEDGAPRLPTSLREATARLDQSGPAREVLGDAFVDHYVRTRDWESRQYEKAVTDWEVARYFESV